METRYLSHCVHEDLAEKMVFLGGPRQVGKTSLAKAILKQKKGSYLNWDIDKDRTEILAKNFQNNSGLIILDEIHKFKRWRNWLKGIYDAKKSDQEILVTGSARLDLYRYGGDSLQGRYHYLRLHPFSVAELGIQTRKDFETLMKLGGFPEPFLRQEERFARRWSIQYRSRLIRDEVPKLETVEDLGSLELLARRIPDLTGSPISINNLREDLDRAFKTVKRWIFVLEKLYHHFPVLAFGNATIRAVKKEQKLYLFDWTNVSDLGARFENLVACHLLKWVHFQEDVEGYEYDLRFFRDRDNREVDFVILKNKQPVFLIECKYSDTGISDHLRFLKRRFPMARAIQLTANGNKEFISPDGIEVIHAWKFLKTLV